MGRPSDYSDDIADEICARIADGQSLNSICKLDEMPSLKTVYNWIGKRPEFLQKYTLARETQADTLADQIVDIADDGSRDYTEDAKGNVLVDHDHITRSRLRVDARKWVAAKLKPKKYGERQDLTVGNPDGTNLACAVTFVKPAA